MEYILQNQGVVFLLDCDPMRAKASFCVNHPGQLEGQESVSWLNENIMAMPVLPSALLGMVKGGCARAVNTRHPAAKSLIEHSWDLPAGKKRVHILALGDVGATLLTGLVLLGGDVISTIGICDMRESVLRRYEYEMNQIAWPFEYNALPAVEPVSQDSLFDCDVFVFCASHTVPPVDSNVEDVRMEQLHGNTAIIKDYARMARGSSFRGLFAVVSDPVDLLCQYVFLESNRSEGGAYDGRGLLPEQVRGYGLGVMNARAAYYAKRDMRYASFLREGRAYGPHGRDLVIANSIDRYDDALSKELSQLAVEANLRMRETGFKPYIAPALSSGAIALLLTMRKEWQYSAVFIDGVYFGCKNRQTDMGLETEVLPLPGLLYDRIRTAHQRLMDQGRQWR